MTAKWFFRRPNLKAKFYHCLGLTIAVSLYFEALINPYCHIQAVENTPRLRKDNECYIIIMTSISASGQEVKKSCLFKGVKL